MLEEIKKKFYSLLKSLGYNVSDNGTYSETFPRLSIRTGGYQSSFSSDLRYDTVVLILDIFSTYNGEKEVIEITEDIVNHLPQFRKDNPDITSVALTSSVIQGDDSTGPIRKHCISKYKFVFTSKLEDDADDTGD